METTGTMSPAFINGREMPQYRSHKIVHALKIRTITYDAGVVKSLNEKAAEIAKEKGEDAPEPQESDGSAMIHFEKDIYDPIKVEADFIRRHSPQIGGYYVVYKDGYSSWSPAQAFEEGYVQV